MIKSNWKISSDTQVRYYVYLILIASFVLLSSCGKDEKKSPPKVDTQAIKDSLEKIEKEKLKITYSYFPDSGKTSISKMKDEFSDDELNVIYYLNRVDRKNFRTRDSVVVPDTFVTNILAYSPFPFQLEEAIEIKKLILFSHTIQAFAAYEYGNLVRWGPTSLGKKSTPTPNGLYHTNWKAKSTISTVNSDWILPWAFNLDNFEGVSMHQFDLPGYPASHACARLLEADAMWFYYWAEQWILTKDSENVRAYGTPVIIFGDYNFGHKPPWHFLPQAADTAGVSESTVNAELNKYVKTILNRQESRDSIVAELEKQKEEETTKTSGKK